MMNENIFLNRLEKNNVIVSDGAIGSQLMEHGLSPGDCPEKFNLEKPDIIRNIAQKYLEAGAEIIQTNTFGASPLKLFDYSLDNKVSKINSRAVEIVREAVGSNAFVSGSVGPTGKMLEPYGNVSKIEIKDNYISQIGTLIDSGVDIICIETMIDLNEAEIAVEATRDISSEIPIIVTMTFDVIPNGCVTIMGNTVESACFTLEKAGANVVGSNCGNGTNNMIKIAQEFITCSQLPIIIQSNAGLPIVIDDNIFYQETPDDFKEFSNTLIDMGILIIGGCCGTTPDHIRAIRLSVDNKK